MSRSKSLDLFVLVAFSGLALGLAFAGLNQGALRVIFGLPLALFVPGYALTTAFLPSLAQAFPNRLMYAIGLSLAVTILTGLLLNLTSEGLTGVLWTGVLGSISLAAGVAGLLWRWRESPDARDTRQRVFTLRPTHAAMLSVAALLVVSAITITRSAAVGEAHPGFTQLWLTPFYPASEQYLEIGLHSVENEPVEYRVQFRIGETVIDEWASVRLQPDELWQKVVRVNDEPLRGERAEVVVYRLDDPEHVYRHATLWFTP
jgi:uncharacterized membrane protein